MVPKPGDVLLVDRQASVQFDGARSLVFRVTVVSKQPTYYGWVWLTGYVLDRHGQAIERREIFVQHDGLRLARATPPRSVSRARPIPTSRTTPPALHRQK